MRRRELLTLLGGAMTWPLVAGAQSSGRLRRVAVLTNVSESDADERARLAVFNQELRQLGWVNDNNVDLEYRWTGASIGLARKFAAEIAGMKPDVVFVVGTTTVSIMLKQTHTIPVVFVTGADPVRVGFVKSMAKPGGNATGVAELEETIGAKWLQLLKEIAPRVNRAVFLHTDSRATLMQLPAIQNSESGISVIPIKVGNMTEIEQALNRYAGQKDVGLIIPPSSTMAVNRNVILASAATHGLPAIYPNRRFVADGGLLSYGIDRIDQYRRVASYVSRILKGAAPADLPVQQSEKFELVINLKAAKALGLDVPRIMLARADEVIE
jgi:putative ABC transport system substrate-binding protein